MPTSNPFEAAVQRSKRDSQRAMLEIARVLSAPNHTLDDDKEHVVRINPKGSNSPVWAQIAVDALGDVHVPSIEDGRVVWALVGYVKGEIPVALSMWYGASDTDVPEYKAGERRISHNLSDANIFFDEDGNVTIENDVGSTVTVTDTDVKINANGGTVLLADESGTTQPVARKGDAVSVDPDTGAGQIDEGSSNVESG